MKQAVMLLGCFVFLSVFSSAFSWLARGDDRNCFCKVVNNDNYSGVFHDFGSIQSCHGFPTCACRRSEMITCGISCDRRVKEWCRSRNTGRTVRSHYIASTCNKGYGHATYQC